VSELALWCCPRRLPGAAADFASQPGLSSWAGQHLHCAELTAPGAVIAAITSCQSQPSAPYRSTRKFSIIRSCVATFYRLLVSSSVYWGVSLLFTGQIVIGAAVAPIPGNLMQLLARAQVLNGIVTPSC
jgi:hypothetical protein